MKMRFLLLMCFATFGFAGGSMETFHGHELVYFYRPTCPYCKRVDRVIAKYKVPVIKKDISNKENCKELIRVGGKQQVPCLVIDSKVMYESKDIINWIEQAAKKP